MSMNQTIQREIMKPNNRLPIFSKFKDLSLQKPMTVYKVNRDQISWAQEQIRENRPNLSSPLNNDSHVDSWLANPKNF